MHPRFLSFLPKSKPFFSRKPKFTFLPIETTQEMTADHEGVPKMMRGLPEVEKTLVEVEMELLVRGKRLSAPCDTWSIVHGSKMERR